VSPRVSLTMPQNISYYRFGPFELKPKTRELFKHGVKLKLRPQPFRVLELLLERAGECVTRDELQAHVWPSNTFVDFEHGLNTAIKQLRGVLGDSATEPRYVETLPKLGYRILGDVEAGAAVPASPTVSTGPAPTDQNAPVVRAVTGAPEVVSASPDRASWALVAGVSLAILLIIGGLAHFKKPLAARSSQNAAASNRKMLAVLPFQNLTGDESQEYFSDGLTEEMIAQIGRIHPREFGVIARTSVMHYKYTSETADQIGRELCVQYVLEGSVRRDSEKVRINATLLKVGSETDLWSHEYDRELNNLLALQEEISREISDEIQETLGGPKSNLPSGNPSTSQKSYEAYDLYLRGLFFWNKRTIPALEQAISYFQQAIAKDPDYAPAYAGVANAYTLLTSYSLTPSSTYMPKARAAALRALEINERLPEAHIALALIVENYDWDWVTAEREYRRGIELNPNYATGHQWYAEFLTWRGRFDEALRQAEMARRLDPLSLIIATDRASVYYYSRQYDQSIQNFSAILEMDPNFPRAYMILSPYTEKGQYDRALQDLVKWHALMDDGPATSATLAFIYGRCGETEKARKELKKIEEQNAREPIDPSALVFANLGLKKNEQALTWLQAAYTQHSNVMTTLKVNPAFDPLRADIRFAELLRKVGLAE